MKISGGTQTGLTGIKIKELHQPVAPMAPAHGTLVCYFNPVKNPCSSHYNAFFNYLLSIIMHKLLKKISVRPVQGKKGVQQQPDVF